MLGTVSDVESVFRKRWPFSSHYSFKSTQEYLVRKRVVRLAAEIILCWNLFSPLFVSASSPCYRHLVLLVSIVAKPKVWLGELKMTARCDLGTGFATWQMKYGAGCWPSFCLAQPGLHLWVSLQGRLHPSLSSQIRAEHTSTRGAGPGLTVHTIHLLYCMRVFHVLM